MPSAAKKNNQWLLPLSFFGVTAAGVALCVFAFRQGPARKASPGPSSVSLAAPASPDSPSSVSPGPVPSSAWPPEEVFRRAFWRQPTAQDRILHAERREATIGPPHTNAGSRDVQSWQWFLALQPSPGLLRSLRDPDTFGLLPTAAPRLWSEPAPEPLPTWFPAAASVPEFEILQAPAGRLTLLYRAADNTLFATDAGAGFAPTAKPGPGSP